MVNNKYSAIESENKILDNLQKSGRIKWNDDKEHLGTWAGYDILGTCLRMYYKYEWYSRLQEYKHIHDICTVSYMIGLKRLETLRDFPSPAELQKLHLRGLELNEDFSQTPDF